MMIHCDYNIVDFAPIVNPKFTKYIGVSQHVCDVFTSKTGIPSEVCYNLVDMDINDVHTPVGKNDKLTIISATRLSSEKGAWRIDKLSQALDGLGIDYVWYIYSNRNPYLRSPHIEVKNPKLDLSGEMRNADFVFQGSDGEAFGFTPVESLIMGTPVIVTDLPVFREIGINESNAIFCNLDMSNIDEVVEKILKGMGRVKYTPPKSNWGEYLSKDKKYDPNKLVDVKLRISNFTDVYENKHFDKSGVTYPTVQWRASYLEAKEYVDICD